MYNGNERLTIVMRRRERARENDKLIEDREGEEKERHSVRFDSRRH